MSNCFKAQATKQFAFVVVACLEREISEWKYQEKFLKVGYVY